MSTANLLLFGVNHKTAPIELREQIAIPTERLAEATRSLASMPGVREAMIVSTCNRVEFLVWTETTAGSHTPNLLAFCNEFFALDHSALGPHVYEYREQEAVRHLFRVASRPGLDGGG